MSDEMLLRDFIYLDIERIRSFVAQASGGLTNEIGSKDEEKGAGKVQMEAGLPAGLLKGTGGVDYHYVQTQSETKSLHDAIFHEFDSNVLEAGHQIDMRGLTVDDWSSDLFADGAFLITEGPIKVVDYDSAAQTLEALPKILSTWA